MYTPGSPGCYRGSGAGNPACLGIWRICYGCQVTSCGQKAAITKDDTNWQLSLSGLMKLGTDEDTEPAWMCRMVWDTKILYEDALISGRKANACLCGQWALLRKTCRAFTDSRAFRIDYCAGRMEIRTVCNLRRGIKYQRSGHITVISRKNQRTRCNSMSGG